MIGTNAIVDLSHHNAGPDLLKAKAAGIVGVIQKATQGISFRDSTFLTNRGKAAAAGLLFGAYHFGTGADGAVQADFFLDVAQPVEGDLLVLDFEENPAGPSMTLEQARAFVTRVKTVRGRWPGLYAGNYLKTLIGSVTDPVLVNCWLWIAQYASAPVIPHGWSKWTMWQYTDGIHGPEPHTIDGIGPCDRDTFNGKLEELFALWQPSAAAAPIT
jgi:lysozyme